MMFNIDCQFEWINNHLGNKLLDILGFLFCFVIFYGEIEGFLKTLASRMLIQRRQKGSLVQHNSGANIDSNYESLIQGSLL